MKRKLTKAEFDALTSQDVRNLYKQEGDTYLLKLSDDDDPDELRRARDREKGDATALRAQVATLTSTVTELTNKLNDTSTNDARKAGDITRLEQSWKDKLTTKETELNDKITKAHKYIEKLLVQDRARAIAVELAGENSELLLPHIQGRLQANFDGNEPTTRVLKDGAISAMTVDELKKEFLDNKAFSAIIVASRASGGATGGNKGNGPTAVPGGKKFHELTERERIEFHQRDKEGFARAAAEAQKK